MTEAVAIAAFFIIIAAFFIIIAAFLYLIYLGNKNNPMSISATEDIMKINNVKEMEKQQIFANVNRVEVIQHSEPYNGRAYTNYNAKDVEIQLQDDNKTLKIFLK
jgi:glutamine cyclotransferase